MGVRNNNIANVILIHACDGLLLLPQSSQITQHVYSVHTAGQETINANTATFRHSLTAVRSSWPVFLLCVNCIHLSGSSNCITACPDCSNNLHLVGSVAAVYSCRLTRYVATFQFRHEDLHTRRHGQCGRGLPPHGPGR